MQKLSLQSPQEMFDLGKELSEYSSIILLEGVLGSGKTTCIKGFAAGLGIDANRVNSPTYTYIQEYMQDSKTLRSAQNGGLRKLLHIDMYNINSFDQLVEKGIAELVHDYSYIAIEWPKFIDELGLDSVTTVSITKSGDQTRDIIVD